MELVYQTNGQDYPVASCCAIATIQWFPSDGILWSNLREVERMEKEVAEFEANIVAKGKSIALATLNSTQTRAAEMLERLGYVCPYDNWAQRDKTIHPHAAGVRVYVKPVYGTFIP
jgi:hypothetical protein